MNAIPMIFLILLSLAAGCVCLAFAPWTGGKKDSAFLEPPEMVARCAVLMAGAVYGVAAIGAGFVIFIDAVLALFWH